ncbi:hypothetical protein [Nocardioides houyundeii]|uniref:hypothetical protein n=1 Tax=Nocardioides houyundeii TaxID=2045452 RepID=UPI000C77A6BA|nr:hypothetical protein [Nocardioides houyundeii]
MKRAWPVLIPVATLSALVAAVPALGAAPAGPAAATTCLGKPVTIVASQAVTTGTEGDDVVAMTPGAWTSFDALGGNDTICLASGAATGGRDPRAPYGAADAGPGDDVVVYSPGQRATGIMEVGLGAGNDTFVGTGAPTMLERVYADSSTEMYSYAETPPPGDHRDVIDMGGAAPQNKGASESYRDSVWSVAPRDAANADRITFGKGRAYLYYRGAMAPEGSLDVTAATQTTLHLPEPGAAEPVARGELLVDAVARRASVAGRQVLAWQGRVDTYQFADEETWDLPVSFLGSDADETLRFDQGTYGDVRLGGGDDWLEAAEYSSSDGVMFRSADGGPGNDTALLVHNCSRLDIRLAARVTCDDSSAAYSGFESAPVTNYKAGGHVTLVGTRADEYLTAVADRVTIHAGGGADDIAVWAQRVRVNAGSGADTVEADGQDVIVRGQAGADRISLSQPRDKVPGKRPVLRRWVALGGPGRDVLTGTSQVKHADRLIGGPGRDRADGDGGARDYCDAEVTRRCERGPARGSDRR